MLVGGWGHHLRRGSVHLRRGRVHLRRIREAWLRGRRGKAGLRGRRSKLVVHVRRGRRLRDVEGKKM